MPKIHELTDYAHTFRNEAAQLHDRYTGPVLWNELLAFSIVLAASYSHNTSGDKLPSVIMDGPVGAGTTTQAEYWQRFFESWIISFGGCMRSISYVANLNNYTPQEVIQAAQSGNLQ